MISSFRLVGCAIASAWQRYAFHGYIPKYYENFLGSRFISDENFMKIRSVVIRILSYFALERWRRSALYKWFSKCKEDFPMARLIPDKIFMEI